AGHNHGGQIRFPVIGSVFVPSRYSRRYDCGTFYEPPTVLHVSPGLGGQEPVRYNCRPEVTKLVLQRATIAYEDPHYCRQASSRHAPPRTTAPVSTRAHTLDKAVVTPRGCKCGSATSGCTSLRAACLPWSITAACRRDAARGPARLALVADRGGAPAPSRK